MADNNSGRLPVVGSPHGDNHTLIRLHEERMGRNEARVEIVAGEVKQCLEKTDRALTTLRHEFIDQLEGLREEMRKRPNEVILYILVGAALVLGGDGIRAVIGHLIP